MKIRSDNKIEKFIEELLRDPQRRQKAAGLRAGYSPQTVKVQTSCIMARQDVKEEIKRREEERKKRWGIDEDTILQELAKIGFANIQDVSDVIDGSKSLKDIDRDVAAAITEISTESTSGGKVDTRKARVKLADKRAALVDIGKHIGMFKNKIEVTGTLTLAQLVEASMKDEE